MFLTVKQMEKLFFLNKQEFLHLLKGNVCEERQKIFLDFLFFFFLLHVY